MTIQQFKARLSAFLQGKASSTEAHQIEEWLQQLEDNALHTPDTGDFHASREKMLLIIRERAVTKARFVRRLMLLQYATASFALFAIVGAAWLFRYDVLDVINPIPMQVVSTSAYDVRNVTLPDGSVVVLNVNSTLQYPQRFRGHERNVSVQGESFFDVKRNPDKPFKISSDKLSVEVLGTSFIVKDYQGDSLASVTVKTGRVKVGTPTGDDNLLVPGNQLVYAKSSNSQLIVADIKADTYWTTRKFAFRDVILKDVFHALASEYGITIQADDAILQKTFTGSFDRTETPQSMLKIISALYDLKVEHANGQYIISQSKK